ncbi:hypothetical protein BKA63DRAFT_592218 [Paraphoma chrysanthemicola]|nr:hypothetical protein BKA63DRAFT_592218 [Paraphoma chrysanthemicola]
MSNEKSSTRGAARPKTLKPSVNQISSGPVSRPRNRPIAPDRLATGGSETGLVFHSIDKSRLGTMAKISKTHAKDFATMSNGVATLLGLVDNMPNGTAKLNLNKELKRLQSLMAKHSNFKHREATHTQAILDSLTARGGRGHAARNVTERPLPQSAETPVTTFKTPKLPDGSKSSKPKDATKPYLSSQPPKLSTISEPCKTRQTSKPAGLLGMLSMNSTTRPRIRMKTQAQMNTSAAKAKELLIDDLFEDPHTAGPVASKTSKEILKPGKEVRNAVRDQYADKDNQDVTSVQKVDTKHEAATSVDQHMPEQPHTEVEMKDGYDSNQPKEPQHNHDVTPSIHSSNQDAEQVAPSPTNAGNTGKDTADEANEARDQTSTNDPALTKEAGDSAHSNHAEDDLIEHGHDETSSNSNLSSSSTATSLFEEAQPAKEPKKPKRDSAIDSSPEAQTHKSNTSNRKSQEAVAKDGTSSDATSIGPKRIGRKNIRRAGQPGVAVPRKISRAPRDTVSDGEEDSDECEDEPVAKEPAKKKPGNKTSKASSQSAKKKRKSDEIVVDNDDDAEDQQPAQGKGKPTSATKPHQPKKSKENEEDHDLNSQGIDLTNIVYGSRRKRTGGGSAPRKHILQPTSDTGSKRKRSDKDDEPSRQKRRALDGRYGPKTRLAAPTVGVDMMEIDSGTAPNLAAPAKPLACPTLAVPRMSLADATYLGDDEL